jgi:hypothetical protein
MLRIPVGDLCFLQTFQALGPAPPPVELAPGFSLGGGGRRGIVWNVT